MNWEQRNFYLKLSFYLLVLIGLFWVAYNGAGDPCERCKLKVDALGDQQYTCREVIEEFVVPRFVKEQTKQEIPNLSNIDLFK